MKKVVASLLLTLLVGMAAAVPVRAVSTTPTQTVPSPTTKAALNEKLNDQINQLKEKIASRVSELNLVEKRGMIGVVSEVSGNKITITDVERKTRLVDVDEITKFSSASNKTFGLSDLKKGTRISLIGLYNKQSKRILARFINASVDPVFLSGSVIAIDSKNFFLTIMTPDQKEIKLDVQTSSKIFSFDQKDDLARYGFSKIVVGDRVTVIGFPDKKDATIIIPNRLIAFIDLPKNPKIVIPDITETDDIKLTPTTTIKKVTPTP